jgi:hypothetical protein
VSTTAPWQFHVMTLTLTYPEPCLSEARLVCEHANDLAELAATIRQANFSEKAQGFVSVARPCLDKGLANFKRWAPRLWQRQFC